MEDESVQAYEAEEYPEEDYDGYHDDGPRRLTGGPILAIVVILIILVAIGFYFFYGTEVDEVRILGIDEFFGSDQNYQGIEVRVLAISGGAQRINGNGVIDVLFENKVVHSQKVSIKDDEGEVQLNYVNFAVENGLYTIKMTMDSVSTTYSEGYYVRHIPHELWVNYTEIFDAEIMDTVTRVLVTPQFDVTGGRAILIKDYNKHFDLKVIYTDPTGELFEIDRTMYEWHRNRSALQLDLEWDMMGNYSVMAEFENNLVKSDSPLKVLESSEDGVGLVTFVNQAPEFGVIEHTKARVDSPFDLKIRAADRDVNGGITSFTIDWDSTDPDNDLEPVLVTEARSITKKVTHTYDARGTYIVTITVADNGYIIEEGENLINNKRFVSIEYEISVTVVL